MQQNVPGELTSRQRQVLTLVARGQSNREIAGELGITEQGVKSHVSRLLLRHDVPNRTALVAATRSWSVSDTAVYDAMDDAMATVRTAVAHPMGRTQGNGGTNGHGDPATNGHGRGSNGHANGGAAATGRPHREVSVETLRRQAAALSSDAPAGVRVALDRLRDIVRELNVALELVRDLPPSESSKVLVKAVARRAADAEKQIATLEGAIAAARR